MINDFKLIDKILRQKVRFVAVGRKFISDKFFLIKNSKKKKTYSHQYTYCF